MRNVHLRVLLALVFTIVLAGTSCVRYRTSSTHTRDTIYVKLQDTTVINVDSAGIKNAESVIETVFMEVEKDCPNIEKAKIKDFKAVINKQACSMETLTGGELKAHSPDLRSAVRFIFKGNEPTAIWEVQQREIQDKETTTIVKEQSYFRKVLDTWHFWAFPWAFFFLWLLLRFRR